MKRIFEGQSEEELSKIKEIFKTNYSSSLVDKGLFEFGKLIPEEMLPVVKMIEPVASEFLSGLNAYKTKKELENIEDALARVILVLREHHEEILCLPEEFRRDISIIYLEHCKETHQKEKIKYFHNIWVNELINADINLDENAYIFNLVASLRLEEILILKFVYQLVREKSPPFVDIFEIAKMMNIDAKRVQQLCNGLQGKGLLHPVYTAGDLDGITAPQNFLITDYVEILIKYITEPKFNKK